MRLKCVTQIKLFQLFGSERPRSALLLLFIFLKFSCEKLTFFLNRYVNHIEVAYSTLYQGAYNLYYSQQKLRKLIK